MVLKGKALACRREPHIASLFGALLLTGNDSHVVTIQ
ncbi:hypothetical protein LCGC14_0353500 [marine sediment metagenome]|uniref:Uncharacterized protein n=1 Tax=marine sediment metagenome TaxID=412755 RepID=A0A0F9WI73_9ZZZZ